MTTAAAEQRDAARAKANRHRLDRTSDHRTVKKARYCEDGMRLVAVMLAEQRPHLATMRAGDLLRWPRHAQSVTAARMLRAAGVGEMTLVGKLTDRQREALIYVISERYGRGTG